MLNLLHHIATLPNAISQTHSFAVLRHLSLLLLQKHQKLLKKRPRLLDTRPPLPIAPMHVRHKVPILVHCILPRHALCIRIHNLLRNQRQPAQHRPVPLYEMLEGVRLSLLKVVAAVERVVPRVQEELCPLALAHDECAGTQALVVLRQDQVDVFGAAGVECADYAVGRDDGLVGNHERLEAGLV